MANKTLSLLAITIVVPILAFFMGALLGWLISLTPMGLWLVDGFELLNIQIVTYDLPVVFGTLAFIGGLFDMSR